MNFFKSFLFILFFFISTACYGASGLKIMNVTGNTSTYTAVTIDEDVRCATAIIKAETSQDMNIIVEDGGSVFTIPAGNALTLNYGRIMENEETLFWFKMATTDGSCQVLMTIGQ